MTTVTHRTAFPLPLRNALAELAIAALDADDAVAALAWLVEPTGTPPPPAAARLVAAHLVDPVVDSGSTTLLDVHAPHAPAVAEHARRALRAAAARRRARTAPQDTHESSDPLRRAVAGAVALWDERLFFEVHEVLEAVWRTAAGDVRQALQGVIQLAVAFHHLEHGNRRGARSLLVEGRSRLGAVAPDILPGLDVAQLRTATATCETALETGDASVEPPPLRTRQAQA
jgi:hypothetical protein